jgi:hypothetical protein
MFEKQTSYTFRYANSQVTTEDGLRRRRHVFVFFNRFGQKYFVWADEFEPNHLFGIKFFPATHSKSDKKFKVLTNIQDVPRTLRTCIEIMLFIRKKQPLSSFAYVAEPKRFRVYNTIMSYFFSDLAYIHETYVEGEDGLYLMRNRAFTQENLDSVKTIDYIIEHYGFVF